MYQKVTIFGRLGADPQMRFTNDGKPVTKLSVAASAGKDKTIWFSVSVWEKTAEWANDVLQKGDAVFVDGVLVPGDDGSPRQWQGKDGTFHSSYEVTAYTVRSSKKKGETSAHVEEESLPF